MMVKCDKSPVAPASLAVEKAKGASGSYRGADVVEQLKTDFHDKCYICELKGLQDPQIEHLRPHKGNIDLKFDWNNLFWSCSHCNNVKNQRKYDGKIINCCQEDPEKHISCQYARNNVEITALDDEITSQMTAELINETFNLQNDKTLMNKRRVIVRLKRSATFAAFKRSYIRNNEEYAELQEYVQL